jgi:hypothetical protein
MIRGVFIAESLRDDASLKFAELQVVAIKRQAPEDTTSEQASIWTLIEFVSTDSQAESIANAFSAALNETGWYADFHSDSESWVVFPHRVFCYKRGDKEQRKQAEDYGRSLRIPVSQLDWPD